MCFVLLYQEVVFLCVDFFICVLVIVLVMLGRFILSILFISCLLEMRYHLLVVLYVLLRVPCMCLHCFLWLSSSFFYCLYISFNHAVCLRVVWTGSYLIYVPLFGKMSQILSI